MKEKIKICDNHSGYEVPLIWTFAFMGCEYWCPYCGFKGGMLGSGHDVEITDKLKIRLEKYKKFSNLYLNAKKNFVCYKTEWMGKYLKPSDLPEKEKNRLRKIIDDWKYHIKIENQKD